MTQIWRTMHGLAIITYCAIVLGGIPTLTSPESNAVIAWGGRLSGRRAHCIGSTPLPALQFDPGHCSSSGGCRCIQTFIETPSFWIRVNPVTGTIAILTMPEDNKSTKSSDYSGTSGSARDAFTVPVHNISQLNASSEESKRKRMENRAAKSQREKQDKQEKDQK